MADAKILRIYLDEIPLRRAEKGNFNIINRIQTAFERHGFRVELCRNSPAERLKSATRRGYSLFHMDDPFHDRALTLRRAYFYPFWRIEKSAQRWEWDIAKARFAPDGIDAAVAKSFCDAWRKRLFGVAEHGSTREGFVYIPLQGRLLENRSFQAVSPIQMIETVLQQEPARRIQVGFHPAELYTPEETQAVEAIAKREPRLSVTDAPMPDLLRTCDYVVTENSSVALNGYFFHKPAILFAQIDFHHIAATVPPLSADQAIKAMDTLAPDYDRYIYWFLKLTAINGGSEEAEDQILSAVRRHGWTVE